MKRFEVGARVVEPTYGLGSVVAVEDAYTRVQFDEHGVKKFLTSMSQLEPSDEPVPAGAAARRPARSASRRKSLRLRLSRRPSLKRKKSIRNSPAGPRLFHSQRHRHPFS